MRDYAQGFDVEKLKAVLDWVNARGLEAEIGDSRGNDNEVVYLRIRNNGLLWGFVLLKEGGTHNVKEGDECLINGRHGIIHAVNKTGYCFGERLFE